MILLYFANDGFWCKLPRFVISIKMSCFWTIFPCYILGKKIHKMFFSYNSFSSPFVILFLCYCSACIYSKWQVKSFLALELLILNVFYGPFVMYTYWIKLFTKNELINASLRCNLAWFYGLRVYIWHLAQNFLWNSIPNVCMKLK